jgi:hypothetical protein
MSISQKSMMERAFRLANTVGVDGASSPVINNTFTPEDLFPIALREAVIERASIPSEADSLKREYALTFTNGVATKPDTLVDECIKHSSLFSVTDPSIGELTSYQERYSDFLRPAYTQLGYYALRGSSIEYRPAYGEINDFDGDLVLSAVGIPDIPAVLTAAMTISTDLAEATITKLAQMMRGT